MAFQAFVFGKLPAHGDFVRRGLSAEAQQLWDDWASGEIHGAREALGEEAFEGAHDFAPAFRFVSGPGGLGPHWRAGAVAPSVDSVGRRFVVVMGLDGLAPHEAAVLGCVLADRCEAALRGALVNALDADAAVADLAAEAPCEAELAVAKQLVTAIQGEGVWWRSGDASIQAGATPPAGLMMKAISELATSRIADER